MALSRPNMCTTCCNHDNTSFLVKCPPLKKWHFLAFSVNVVGITTGFSYSNRSLLKKWHFLDIIYAIYVVTIRKLVFFVKSLLLKKWTLYVQYR